MKESSWEKTFKISGILSFICLVFSIIIWCICGGKINIGLGLPLNLNFYNTFCGTLTLAGFFVALWQISELKNRQEEIVEETNKALSIMRNLQDVERIVKLQETISYTKTLAVKKKYQELDNKIPDLKDELHRCKRICPEFEQRSSDALVQLTNVQVNLNRVRLSDGNPVDINHILVTFDEIRDLFALIIDICKTR